MPKGFKNMKAKAKAKAVNFAAKKIYGADVIEAVAEDWCAAPPPCTQCERLRADRRLPAPAACRPASWTCSRSGWTRIRMSSRLACRPTPRACTPPSERAPYSER